MNYLDLKRVVAGGEVIEVTIISPDHDLAYMVEDRALLGARMRLSSPVLSLRYRERGERTRLMSELFIWQLNGIEVDSGAEAELHHRFIADAQIVDLRK